MKEFLLILLGIFIGGFFGWLITANNSVSENEHTATCKEYEQTIASYQDYVEGLDKVVNIDTLNNGALEVLRNRLPNQNSNE